MDSTAGEAERNGGGERDVRSLTRRRMDALGLVSTVATFGESHEVSAQADGIVLEDGRG